MINSTLESISDTLIDMVGQYRELALCCCLLSLIHEEGDNLKDKTKWFMLLDIRFYLEELERTEEIRECIRKLDDCIDHLRHKSKPKTDPLTVEETNKLLGLL